MQVNNTIILSQLEEMEQTIIKLKNVLLSHTDEIVEIKAVEKTKEIDYYLSLLSARVVQSLHIANYTPVELADDYLELLSSRIIQARNFAKYTQVELADRLNIGRRTLQILEEGAGDPKATIILQISEICGVDPCWLLTGNQAAGADKSCDTPKSSPSPQISYFRDELMQKHGMRMVDIASVYNITQAAVSKSLLTEKGMVAKAILACDNNEELDAHMVSLKEKFQLSVNHDL